MFRFVLDFARFAPRKFLALIGVQVLDVIISSLSIVSIVPVADVLLEPESEWMAVTQNYQGWVLSLGLEFNLLTASVGLWLIMLVSAVSSVLVRNVSLNVRFYVTGRMIKESFDEIFHSGWRVFSSIQSGALINNFLVEIPKACGGLFFALNLISNILRIIAYLVVPLYMQPLLVASCVIVALVALVPFVLLGRITKKHASDTVVFGGTFGSLLKESLDGAKEVLAFSKEDFTSGQIFDAYHRRARAAKKSQLLAYMSGQYFEPIGFLVVLAALVIARGNGVDIAALALVFWALMRAIPLIKQSISLKHSVDMAIPSYNQVLEFRGVAARFAHPHTGTLNPVFGGAIEFSGVSFSYDTGVPGLQRIDLQIPRGNIVAIVGESGGGKSTIVDLLLGLQEPEEGKILLDGTSLHEIDILKWREGIGLVTQKPVLLNMSIYDNILWGNPDASEADVLRVCQHAGVDQFLGKSNLRIHEPVGDSGIKLSGGQAQRIAIARALARNPALLILDEATSALDGEIESRILDTLFSKRGDMSILIVAHRLSTIKRADKIYAVRGGRIVEEGSYQELTDSDGYFASLVRSQLL